MTRAAGLSPFRFRDGRLMVENVALTDLSAALEGREDGVPRDDPRGAPLERLSHLGEVDTLELQPAVDEREGLQPPAQASSSRRSARRSSIRPWIWHTRDSEMPSRSPMALSVSPSK